MMGNRVLGFMFFLLGVLIALTPVYILPVCEFHGKPKMVCSYTGMAEIFVGLIILSIGVGAFLSKVSVKWLMFVAFFAGASVIFVPEVLGYCPSPRMPCHYGTVPMLRLLGGLTVVVSVTGFAISKEG